MPKTKISEFSATPGNNTDIDGINIAEGCAPSGINDAIRELMSQLKDFQAGTAGDSFNGPVGTTTAAAGAFTTLSASSTVSGTGFSNYLASPPAIGGTAAAAGSFTTLTTSSTVTHNGGTANGVAYLNGSKVLTTGSALTFDGTNFVLNNGYIRANNTIGYYTTLTATGLTNYATTMDFDSVSSYLFKIGGSEQMRLTSTGLGIGTSSPGERLNVVGGGSTSSTVNFTGGSNNDNATIASDYSLVFQVDANNSIGGREFNWRVGGKGYSDGTSLMRLDSSGNLGLGVTPSAWSGLKAFQINTQASVSADGTSIHVGINAYYGSGGWTYIGSGYASNYYQLNGAHVWRTAPSGTAGNAITFTQAMTLDASGNLGVGSTSPSQSWTGGSARVAQLQGGSSQITVLRVNESSGTYGDLQLVSGASAEVGIYNFANGAMRFGTNGTERARIDSSGNLLVGTTSATPAASDVNGVAIKGDGGSSQFTGDGGSAITINRKASDGSVVSIRRGGTEVGTISVTASATAYNTSSDYRLKENIQPMTGALAKVAQLKPCTYKWKADGSAGEGFIAHELAEVVPQCVTGEKDAVDAEGKPVYQGIDTSFLVATLTAALQEAVAEINQLKARLDAANL